MLVCNPMPIQKNPHFFLFCFCFCFCFSRFVSSPCTARHDVVCRNITICDSDGRSAFDTYVADDTVAAPECERYSIYFAFAVLSLKTNKKSL